MGTLVPESIMKSWKSTKAQSYIVAEEQEWQHSEIEGTDKDPLLAFNSKKDMMAILEYFWQKGFRPEVTKQEYSGHKTFLELAAGSGWATILLSEWLIDQCGWSSDDEFIVSDASTFALEKAKQVANSKEIKQDYPHSQINQFLVNDAHEIPLPDQSVDILFVSAAMHHMVDPLQVTKEIYRVLKPGGLFLCIGEPIVSSLIRPLYSRLSGAMKRSNKLGVNEDTFTYRQLINIFTMAGFQEHKIMPNRVAKFRQNNALKRGYYALTKLLPDKILLNFLMSSIVFTAKK